MSNEPKHTPGPWQMSGSRGLSPEYRGHGVGPDGKDYVVVVPYNDKDHAECIANARLIGAAPDLLAACKALYATHKQGKGQCCSAADMAIDAIAKAEGRQP